MVTPKNVKDPRICVSQKAFKAVKGLAKKQKTSMAAFATQFIEDALCY